MVRLIPNRLRGSYSNSSSTKSTTNNNNTSRTASPMRSKGDSASPEGRRETGLVLSVGILKVGSLCSNFVALIVCADTVARPGTSPPRIGGALQTQ